MDSKVQNYRDKARLIAAAVVKERGYRWAAAQIYQGKRDGCTEVEIAVRALMHANGEYEAKEDSGLTSFGYKPFR